MKGWIIKDKIPSARKLLCRIKDVELVRKGIDTNDDNLLFENPIRKLYLEGLDRGYDIRVVVPEDISFTITKHREVQFFLEQEKIETPQFVIPSTGSETSNFAIALYRQLELLDVPMINNLTGVIVTMDKFQSLQLLGHQGLPIPKSMLITRRIYFDTIEDNFTFPLIAKIWPSTDGEGVMLIHDKYNLEDMVKLIRSANPTTNILVQEYIKSSRGRDIRVVVLNGEVIAMGERKATDGGYKSNFNRGGSARGLEGMEEVKELAIQTAKALKLEYAGVDILYDIDGYKICEVNSAPGFFIFDLLDINMAAILYDYLINKINSKIRNP